MDVLDKDGDPPLVFALAAGSPDCVHALIKRGANVRSRLREGLGPSVAHVCAYHGQPDCMRVSLQLITSNHGCCLCLLHCVKVLCLRDVLISGVAISWS